MGNSRKKDLDIEMVVMQRKLSRQQRDLAEHMYKARKGVLELLVTVERDVESIMDTVDGLRAIKGNSKCYLGHWQAALEVMKFKDLVASLGEEAKMGKARRIAGLKEEAERGADIELVGVAGGRGLVSIDAGERFGLAAREFQLLTVLVDDGDVARTEDGWVKVPAIARRMRKLTGKKMSDTNITTILDRARNRFESNGENRFLLQQMETLKGETVLRFVRRK